MPTRIRRRRSRPCTSPRRTSRRAPDRTGSRRSAGARPEPARPRERAGTTASDVIASNASATPSRRASIGISSPARPVRIAGAVPALVVVEHVRQGRPEVLDGLDQARAGDRMRPDLGQLLVRERAGLAEHASQSTAILPTSWSEAPSRSASSRSPRQPSLRARPSAIEVTRAEWPRRYGSRASSAAEKVASSDPTVPDFPERAPVPFLAVGRAP